MVNHENVMPKMKICLFIVFMIAFASKVLGGSIKTEYITGLAQKNCSAWYFSCASRSQLCIPLKWRCDGDLDCDDGSDEVGCGPCNENEMQCNNGKCISQGLVCDGNMHCDDGSDENSFLCQFDDTCQYFGAPCRTPPHDCVPFENLCDGRNDCPNDDSDESNCYELPVPPNSCTRCDYRCTALPSGAHTCYCPEGQILNKSDNATCETVDICHLIDPCDQVCASNFSWSYSCSCVLGFTASEIEGKTVCVLDDTDDEPYIVVSQISHIQKFYLNGTVLSSPFPAHAKMLDYDLQRNKLYWISQINRTHSSQLNCVDLEDFSNSKQIKLPFDLDDVVDMKVDWVTGNIYFINGRPGFLFVCNATVIPRCNYLGSNPNGYPYISLTLDRHNAKLFIGIGGKYARVIMLNMDGEYDHTYVRQKLVNPAKIALNVFGNRLFIYDSYIGSIDVVSNGGKRRKVIAKLPNFSPSGMAYFNNTLFLSSLVNQSLVTIDVNKVSSREGHLSYLLNSTRLGTVHVVHSSKQTRFRIESSSDPIVPNLACSILNCEHICLVGVSRANHRPKVSCHCAIGYVLASNRRACQKTAHHEKFIIYNAVVQQRGSIKVTSLSRNQSLNVLLPSIHNVNPKSTDYYRDKNGSDWLIYTKFSYSAVSLVCASLAVDWVNENVYCLSRNFARIIVSSLRQPTLDASFQIYPNLYRFNPAASEYKSLDLANNSSLLRMSHSLVLHPVKGQMYWATAKSIYTSWMNGANLTTFWSLDESILVHPTALTIDYSENVIYWADFYKTGIAMADLNSKKAKVLFLSSDLPHSQRSLYFPVAISFYENQEPGYLIGRYLFWAEGFSGNIYRLDLNKVNSTSFPVDAIEIAAELQTRLINMLVFNPSTRTGDGLCKGANCSDICVPIPEKPYYACLCPDNKNMSSDGVSCEAKGNISLASPPPCPSFRFLCADGRCIGSLWVCDGHNDCSDGGDELGSICGNRTCSEGRFHCNSTRSCISSQWVCDGEEDCLDGEDEVANICGDHVCEKDEFRCPNGACILNEFVCDNDFDCLDGSDERANCSNNTSCEVGEFRCLSGRCIQTSWLCDEEEDCDDGSDEHNCDLFGGFQPESPIQPGSPVQPGSSACRNAESFACNSNDDSVRCILNAWRCDGDKDCFDGEDEKNCPHIACSPHSRPCASGKCIFNSWWCDGEAECPDNSDETNCSCPDNQIRCLTRNFIHECVDVCSGVQDCIDGEDERNCSHALSCEDVLCSHTCVDRPNGFECLCPKDKRLGTDQKTCEDILYCSELGRCSQNCSEDLTSYRCSCYRGWHVDSLYPAGDKCAYDKSDPPPFVMYATRHALKYFVLSSGTIRNPRRFATRKSKMLLGGLRHLLAFDYHFKKRLLFYSDVTDDAIFKATLGYNRISQSLQVRRNTRIISNALPSAEGLAVDWIAERIYFVDSSRDHIEAADFDGNHRSILVAGDMDSPRALAVDPRYGYMFWTVWDAVDAKVERATLAGENRTTIWSLGKDDSGWPNGLTIDYLEERVYWAGAKYNMIWAAKYDGGNMLEILSNVAWISHPFAMTTYSHHILWTDWQTRLIGIADKWPGSKAAVLEITFRKPFDIKVFHESRQPRTTTNSHKIIRNPCQNASCEGLCVVSPGAVKHRCMCSYQQEFHSNGRCRPLGSYMLMAYNSEITGLRLVDLNFSAIYGIAYPDVQNLTRLAYDGSRDQVYWSDASKMEIIRAFVNSSGVETAIGVDSPNVTGLVIDWLREKIYWTSIDIETSSPRLYLATLNGRFKYRLDKNASSSVWKRLSNVRFLTADVPAAKLYFAADSGIYSVHMDGNALARISKLKTVSDLRFHNNSLYCVTNGKVVQLFRGKCRNGFWCQKNLNYTATLVAPMGLDSMFVYNAGVIRQCESGVCNFRLQKRKLQYLQDFLIFDKSQQNSTNLASLPCAANANPCDQICLPSVRNTSQCRCTIGYKIHSRDLTACEGISEFLIYSTSSVVRGLPLNQSSDDSLVTVTDQTLANGVDFLAAKDMMIWIESATSSIKAAYRNMTKKWTIYSPYRKSDGVTATRSLQFTFSYSGHRYIGLAVDWIAMNIYWTDESFKEVKMVRLDGMYPYTLIRGKNNRLFRGLSVHPIRRYLFIGDWSSLGQILRTNLDGSNETTILKDVGWPNGITIDFESDTLYWSDTNGNTIKSSDFNGNFVKKIYGVYRRSQRVHGVTLFDGQIYWTDRLQGGSISTCNVSSTSSCKHPRVVGSRLGSSINDVIVYSPLRQPGSKNLCSVKNGGCEQLCFYLGSNQRRCACSVGHLNQADNQTCLPSERHIFFSDRKRIYNVDIDNPQGPSDPLPLIESPLDMSFVVAMATDYHHQRLFYSDAGFDTIYALNISFDGRRFPVPEKVVERVGDVEGIAYHKHENALYWTSVDHRAIMKHSLSSPLRNSSTTVVQGSPFDLLRAIALYECESPNFIFWTNWNKEDPSILRSSIEGENLTKIISKVNSDIHVPNGLTIDPIAKHIYWVDATLDKIERCNFEGLNRKVIKAKGVEHGFAIAVMGEYLYWTDWTSDRVFRVNKWTGLNTQVVRSVQYSQALSVVAYYNDTCISNPCLTHHCDYSCVVSFNGEPQCMCPNGSISDSCNSDERRCPSEQFSCGQPGFFPAGSPVRCVAYEVTCDGTRDCSNGMDEGPLYCNSRTCRKNYTLCSNNDRCIPNNLLCNGEDNCRDDVASDEQNCPPARQPASCTNGQFTCNNGRCIPMSWQCDGDDDCNDNSDEKCSRKCSSGTMECEVDDACIPNSYKCDGEEDCSDGSDEEHCDTSGCLPGHFKCLNSEKCIPLRWVCDGGSDCTDGSDEKSCSNSFCGSDLFKCNNSEKCIKNDWLCDRDFDCPDGSDEGKRCNYPECDGLLCSDNVTCVVHEYICDTDRDCPNGEDEVGCPTDSSCDTTTHLLCPDQTCIPLSKACDGIEDCWPESIDESACNISECSDRSRNSCQQICLEKNYRYSCSCFPGYRLQYDQHTCRDIDECLEMNPFPPCSQVCNNDANGGYRCSCVRGYVRNKTDPSNCMLSVDSFVKPYFLLSDRHTVQKVKTRNSFHKQILSSKPGRGIALDYDWRRQKFYWSVTYFKQTRMYVVDLNSTSKNSSKTFFDHNVGDINGIAVDWVAGNLYWTDQVRKIISVAKLDSARYSKALITENLSKPTAIVVDPQKGFLFWSDQGDKPYIGRAGMDGSQQTMILHNGTLVKNFSDRWPGKKLAWPNALALDYPSKRLFWADSKEGYIASCDYDGARPRLVPLKYHDRAHGFRVLFLSIFEDRLYYADWKDPFVKSVHKFSGLSRNGSKPEHVFFNSHSFAMELKVVHPILQPIPSHPHPCTVDNGGCEDLCLIQPGGTYRCDCPRNYYLGRNKRSCLSNCTYSEFSCNNDRCIPSWWKCDGVIDCADGSDEPSSCREFFCEPGEFQCFYSTKHDHKCVTPSRICDGTMECRDASDEINCDKHVCMSSQLKCDKSHPPHCIAASLRCDGRRDCSMGEDEDDCPAPPICTSDEFQCERMNLGTGEPVIPSLHRCIPIAWKCDGMTDCVRGVDELHCDKSNRSCPENLFQCEKTAQCISISKKCDHELDCKDGSDELPTACFAGCLDKEFQCKKYKFCIPSRFVCDGYDDCLNDDKSDEENCEAPTMKCAEGEFGCADGSSCIDAAYRCDDEEDCVDGSDERNCSRVTCQKDKFKCEGTRTCLPLSFRCDGFAHCLSASDERNCTGTHLPALTCPSYMFRCEDGECIPLHWKCNGRIDCYDSSDEGPICEKDCTLERPLRCGDICYSFSQFCDGIRDCIGGDDEPPPCLTRNKFVAHVSNSTHCMEWSQYVIKSNTFEFLCPNGDCVPTYTLCDGLGDCSHGFDEKTCRKEFCNDSNPCWDIHGSKCFPLPRRALSKWYKSYCRCEDGYRPANTFSGRLYCEDINECETLSPCSHKCINTPGSFRCVCREGWSVFNKIYCRNDADSPLLAIAAFSPFRLRFYRSIEANVKLKAINNYSSTKITDDFYINRMVSPDNGSTIFASDSKASTIYKITSNDIIPVIQFSIKRRITGLALDATRRNLLWTDATDCSVNIAKIDLGRESSKRKRSIKVKHYFTLFNRSNSPLLWPLDVAAQPKSSFIFVSDGGDNITGGVIYKFDILQGRNISRNHRIISSNIEWPVSLSVDTFGERLYWSDSKKHIISSSDFNGARVKVVYYFLGQPNLINVFGDFIYVLDATYREVGRISKLSRILPFQNSTPAPWQSSANPSFKHQYRESYFKILAFTNRPLPFLVLHSSLSYPDLPSCTSCSDFANQGFCMFNKRGNLSCVCQSSSSDSWTLNRCPCNGALCSDEEICDQGVCKCVGSCPKVSDNNNSASLFLIAVATLLIIVFSAVFLWALCFRRNSYCRRHARRLFVSRHGNIVNAGPEMVYRDLINRESDPNSPSPSSPASSHDTNSTGLLSQDPTKSEEVDDGLSASYRVHYSRGEDYESETAQLIFPNQSRLELVERD